ncbi:AAA family ATPase [Paracoccaceae bacterium GXU_MW_L88]
MINRAKDRSMINILDASSGEISIVAGMLGVASNIEDNSLILIDEPEISLHPEWQEQYVELLRSTFSPFSGCHFVIATHSPIILSDIGSEGSHVVSLSENEISKQKAEVYAGASVDQLLVTAFGVVGNENLFLKQEAIKTLNHLVRGSTSDDSLLERLKFLESARVAIGDDTELAKLIDDLLEAASDVGKFG